MTTPLTGPPTPFQELISLHPHFERGLPPAFQSIYGGDWPLLAATAERPYLYTNFVVTHDGWISLNQPKAMGGGSISRHSLHDRWLMALLRARADAIVVGATTLRLAKRHSWTPDGVFADDGKAFDDLRASEKRQRLPLLVIVTLGGNLPFDAPALHQQPVLIATTHEAAERHGANFDPAWQVHLSQGQTLDFSDLLLHLRKDHGIQSMLSEAGARIYGEFLKARLIDDEFLSRSPMLAGNPAPPAEPRISLVEGAAFDPDQAPDAELLSLRYGGGLLFQHSRLRWPEKPAD